MSWLLLSLISAFCLASADAATKKFIHHYRADEIVLIRFGLAGLLLLPLLLGQSWPELNTEFWLWLAALLPIELLAMRLYMEAIRSTDLSLTLPLLAFTPVFNIITGYLILGETIHFNGLIGIGFVVFGSWILNLQTQSQTRLNLFAPFKIMMTTRGSRLMLFVAALYSLTSVFSKGILQTVRPGFFGPFYIVVLGLITVLYLQIKQRQPIKIINRKPIAHCLIATFSAGMIFAHFYAIDQVQVAYMIAIKRTSLLFGMIYGACLFGETEIPRKLLAGSLMVFGVFLISS